MFFASVIFSRSFRDEANPHPAEIYDVLLALPAEGIIISDKQAPMPEGAKVIEATYCKPYMAHASIGPSCAATMRSVKCDATR
jgi:hypothetical protein